MSYIHELLEELYFAIRNAILEFFCKKEKLYPHKPQPKILESLLKLRAKEFSSQNGVILETYDDVVVRMYTMVLHRFALVAPNKSLEDRKHIAATDIVSEFLGWKKHSFVNFRIKDYPTRKLAKSLYKHTKKMLEKSKPNISTEERERLVFSTILSVLLKIEVFGVTEIEQFIVL